MAVTILERPKGYILSSTAIEGDSYDFGGNYQIRTDSPHGLVTGDVFYAVSNIDVYNGFFKVGAYGAVEIEALTLDGNNIDFLQIVEVTIYASTFTHGWSAVHLPITYRLSTDLYPTNSVDTIRNINSVQNANGYTVLQLSGSLGTIHTYDFVKLTLPNDTDLSGVYQILEWISSTVVIINLEYNSANDFTSATALKHYNNYNILVRVYAGLNVSHQWTAQKPYELAATLQFVPDENNEVFFSINELLKSYIETRNNLVLGTLPNNIDFFTQFYIETAESYDDSDGYTFGTTTSSYTSDQSNFEGVAVNAKLEFKNIQSGYLSEYLMTNNQAKFLTLFVTGVLFSCGDDTPDCYSDISFLNPNDNLELIVNKQFYADGNAGLLVSDNLGVIDSGVIRVEIEPNCSYDRVDISIIHAADIGELSDYTDFGGPFPWTTGATPSISLSGSDDSNSLRHSFLGIKNVTYRITYDITMSGGGVNQTFDIVFLNQSALTTNGVGSIQLVNGSNVGYFDIASSEDVYYIALSISNFSGTNTYTINSLSVSNPTISETKQFDIDCGCSNQEIRLTWLNNLGGFEPSWAFTAQSDHIREIQEAMTTKKNILPQWPKSYGADADTIRKQTKRISNKAYTVRSQLVTEDQIDALAYIKSSLLVQIINSRTDRRTVIVDTDSFIIRKDGDKTHEIAFNISFTDDIPVQTL